MSKKLLLIFFFAGYTFLYGWRAWYFVDTGAHSTGIGEACVASIDIPSLLDVQPASTGFSVHPMITWDIATSLTLIDPLSGHYKLAPDPLLSLSFSLRADDA
ncbi:MAG: hypothetical protein ACK4HQ_05240 [Brevinematales bacterium]